MPNFFLRPYQSRTVTGLLDHKACITIIRNALLRMIDRGFVSGPTNTRMTLNDAYKVGQREDVARTFDAYGEYEAAQCVRDGVLSVSEFEYYVLGYDAFDDYDSPTIPLGTSIWPNDARPFRNFTVGIRTFRSR